MRVAKESFGIMVLNLSPEPVITAEREPQEACLQRGSPEHPPHVPGQQDHVADECLIMLLGRHG